MIATVATVPSIVKKTKDSVNVGKTCFNERNRENKCSYRVFITASRVCVKMWLIHHKCE